MKNLKKVGAVALAAVMAVTFAPVASLNVFAAIPTGDKPIATSIAAAGTYAYEGGGADADTDVVATKSCTIDLNGQTVTGTIKAQEGAKITIIDTGATKGKVSGAITIGDASGHVAKDDTTSGALVVKGAALGTVNLVKGDVTVKSGSVASIAAADVAASSQTAEEIKALKGKSTITIEGGTVTIEPPTVGGTDLSLGTPAATTEADVYKGKNTLKNIKISGGIVNLPAVITPGQGYEHPKNENGDFVTITGGTFKTPANFGTYSDQAGTAAYYLNTVAEKALPVAVDDTTSVHEFYVGNAAIEDALTSGGDITVINGDAVLDKIDETSGTIVNNIAVTDTSLILKGTIPTVNVTAKTGVSLLNVDTKAVIHRTVVESTAYTFGWDNVKSAVENLLSANDVLLSGYTEFQRALKVNYASDSEGDGNDFKFELEGNNKVWAAPDNTKSYATNLTYFTEDPSKHVSYGTGVALIDGTYYVAGDDGKAYQTARKSVKVLKTNSWAKATDSKTENQEATMEFNVYPAVAANVTGPDDTMVVIYNPTRKSVSLGADPTYTPSAKAWVFGKDSDTTVQDNDGIGNGVDGTVVTAAELIVNGVVGDGFDVDDVDAKVAVKTADGIDWWTDNADSASPRDEYKYHFAKTDKANEDFKNNLLGYTTKEGVKLDPKITGAVRVSTGISGEFENVTTGVNIDAEWAGGEQTSTLSIDKKSRTWYVNYENKNLPQNVYRLRAKVGNNHLYTMNKDEADDAVASGAWVLETGKAFTMLPWNTTVEGAVKVLRFRNVRTNEFLYTTDPKEQADLFASADWAEGNVAFCGVSKETGYPVTRLKSLIGQGHLYSTAKAEAESAVKNDFFQQEGTAFWAVETPEKEK